MFEIPVQEDGESLSLKCNISLEVNQLEEGIKLALKDDREKNSEALGRLAVFAGSSVISSLPPYLTVHMVRFFYKADVQQKAKILRKVCLPTFSDDALKCLCFPSHTFLLRLVRIWMDIVYDASSTVLCESIEITRAACTIFQHLQLDH